MSKKQYSRKLKFQVLLEALRGRRHLAGRAHHRSPCCVNNLAGGELSRWAFSDLPPSGTTALRSRAVPAGSGNANRDFGVFPQALADADPTGCHQGPGGSPARMRENGWGDRRSRWAAELHSW
jgi:hypothetical protein